MTSPHWAEVRFLVPPLSKWSAISSDMKVFKSTSWSPFLLRLALEPLLTWVGEPGVLERTLILAIAPLRPGGEKKKKYLGQTVKKVNFPCVAEGIKLIWLLVTRYRHFVLLLLPQVQITCSQLLDHKNLAMTQTAFYDIKTELIHQVVTALYGKC